MPQWVINIVLPYVVPVIVQDLTPIIVEYVKKAADYMNNKLPSSMVVALAGIIAEAVNQASAWLAGASLPPGVGPIIAVFIKAVGKDFGKQPPTPGVK